MTTPFDLICQALTATSAPFPAVEEGFMCGEPGSPDQTYVVYFSKVDEDFWASSKKILDGIAQACGLQGSALFSLDDDDGNNIYHTHFLGSLNDLHPWGVKVDVTLPHRHNLDNPSEVEITIFAQQRKLQKDLSQQQNLRLADLAKSVLDLVENTIGQDRAQIGDLLELIRQDPRGEQLTSVWQATLNREQLDEITPITPGKRPTKRL